MADDSTNMAVEMAGLRGAMDTGFAKLEGQLNLLVQSDVNRQRDLTELEGRVTALEARRVPLGLLATVSGAVSAVVAAGAFLAQM